MSHIHHSSNSLGVDSEKRNGDGMTKMTAGEIYLAAMEMSPRPKKDAGINILRNAIEYGEELGDWELATLYALLIPAQRKPKNPFQWVASACMPMSMSESGYPEYTKFVRVHESSRGRRMVATDGAILLSAPTDLAPGLYNAQQDRVEADNQFPNYESLFADLSNYRIVDIDRLPTGYWNAEKVVPFRRFQYEIGYEVWIQGALLKKALALDPKTCGEQKVVTGGPMRPILLLLSNGRQAMLAPMEQPDSITEALCSGLLHLD